MSFTETFLPFVCEGDTIRCNVDGYDITARIVRDNCTDAPDQRQDGFWPSLTIGDAGFIDPGNDFRQRFAEAEAKAEAIMAAWKSGDWFYCGIVLSVALGEIDLDRQAASLWGVEANFPGSENAYLTEVASELLPDALARARAALARLVEGTAPKPRIEIIVSGGVVQNVIVTGGAAEIVINDLDHLS